MTKASFIVNPSVYEIVTASLALVYVRGPKVPVAPSLHPAARWCSISAVSKKLPKHVRFYAKTGKYRAVVTVTGQRIHGPLRASVDDASMDAMKLISQRAKVTGGDYTPTIAEGFAAVLAQIDQEGLSPQTADYYRSKLRVLTKPGAWGRDLPLGAITPDQIRRYIARRETEVSRATVWHELTALSRVIRTAQRDGKVETNPFDQVKRPKIRRERFKSLTSDEIKAIVSELRRRPDNTAPGAGENFAALVELFFFTGIRRLEAARLRVSDVDLDARLLHVTGKTGNRTVPLSESALKSIRHLISTTKRKGFVTSSESAITRRFVAYRSRLGLDDFSPHVLRHSFATEMVNAGVQPFVLAKLLGHRDIKMTMHYFHGRADVERDAIERLHFTEP